MRSLMVLLIDLGSSLKTDDFTQRRCESKGNGTLIFANHR